MSDHPEVRGFYEPVTGSVQYVVWNPANRRGAVIDPVWDFDLRAKTTNTLSADAILAFVEAENLHIEWVLDTHPHADHFSAGPYLREALARRSGAAPRTGIGERVVEIQALWRKILNDPSLPEDGAPWDHLFTDGDRFQIGGIETQVILSPGHTLASISFVVGDAAFVHDTLFMPDSGTARADFPGGSAATLYDSIQRLFELPDATRVFVGHDYGQGGREPAWSSTIGGQKATNIHVGGGRGRDDFVRIREGRDATLPLPDRIFEALQVNLRGGRLPEPDANGVSYLRMPINPRL